MKLGAVTPSERLLQIVQQAHAKKETPAGPLPEAIDGGDWEVIETPGRQSHVKLNNEGAGGEMEVPLGETKKERLYRAHEMAHIALSPRGDIVTKADPQLIQLAEDLRINTQLMGVGFDFDEALMTDDEKIKIVDTATNGVIVGQAAVRDAAPGSGSHERGKEMVAKHLRQALGLLVATQRTADHEPLAYMMREQTKLKYGEQLVAMSDVVAERYFTEQDMLDSFELSTLQAAAEMDDRVKWMLEQPEVPYPGDPTPDEQGDGDGGSQDEAPEQSGEGSGSGSGSGDGEPSDDDGDADDGDQDGGEKPAERTPAAAKPGAPRPKPATPKPAAPKPTGGKPGKKPEYKKTSHLPEFHGFRPTPKKQETPAGGMGGYSFKPAMGELDGKPMKMQAWQPGIPWRESKSSEEPLYDGHKKLSDLTTDQALLEIIRTTPEGQDPAKTGPPPGEMSIIEVPRPRRLPNKVMGKKVRHSEDGLLRNPSRLASCDARVFARTRRKKGGGTLLIDQSGSMSLSLAQVEAIIKAIPAAIIAGYDGYNGKGNLRILAKQGKMADRAGLKPIGGSNIVDVPALEWLSKQKEPRIWVSDGWVTGTRGVGSGESISPRCAIEAAKIIKRARIARVPDIYELLQTLGVEDADDDDDRDY